MVRAWDAWDAWGVPAHLAAAPEGHVGEVFEEGEGFDVALDGRRREVHNLLKHEPGMNHPLS